MTPLHDIAETAAALGQDDLAAQVRQWAGEVERLRSELEAAKKDAGWQPIETAPKDGAEILLTNGVVVAQGHWLHAEPYVRERRDVDGRYIDQDESDGYDGWIDFSGGMLPEPTHWMPLPPAPAIDAEMAKDSAHAAYMAASNALGQEL